MSKIFQIQINFPVGIDWPPGFEQALDALVNMICEKYEEENPTRTMWTAGHGAKLLWCEPMEPDSNDSVYCIDISERETTKRELQRRFPTPDHPPVEATEGGCSSSGEQA